MTKNYRFRTKLGQDREVRLQIEQDFDMIEILSLKLKQEDVYTRFCADYGVVAGRVIANGGYGVPNVSVSIFVPLTAQDENDPIISTLYPYKLGNQKNEDGYRYNLLPYKKEYGGHTPTGTFPDIQDILERKEVLEIYEKYYKYTVRTNDSGDFMIVGVPLGMQTIVMDMDLSNIGCFSLRPSDLIRMGMAVESQFNGAQFKSAINIESLPQIINSKKDIEVSSFWGENEICNVGITRVDFDIRDLGVNIEPQAIFMGSMITTTEEGALGANCKPKLDSGNLCDLVSGPGKILSIRQTIYTDVLGYPILEEYKLPEGGSVIGDEGTWLVEVPMNLDFVTTNEFGEQVFSNDPNKGIPTKAKYRFKIQYQNEDPNESLILRADYLVPNIKEYGWNTNSNYQDAPQFPDLQKKSYAFSLDWEDYGDTGTTLGNQIIQEAIDCKDKFFEFNFNRVYTISSFIDRWKWGFNRARHMGIKEITDRTCNTTTNKMPVNDGVRNFDFIFFLFNLLITILSPIFLIIIIVYHFVAKIYPVIRRIVNSVIRGINNIIQVICNYLNEIREFFGKDPKDCERNLLNELEEKTFPRISLPMMAYPDCEACNCETIQSGSDPSDTYPDNDFTNERVNQSQLIDVNSVGEWDWMETSEYNNYQTYCPEFPDGCDVTENTLIYGVNQGLAGYSGPTSNGKNKLQKTPISTWVSQDSRIGSQSYTIHWAQILNLMNARERYFENKSVITTTIKNINFQNIEEISQPFEDQPLILICDPGTIDSIGGSGSLITFSNLFNVNDPNLTGLTQNQFNTKSVTGTSNYNLTELVNKSITYIKPVFDNQTVNTSILKLKLTNPTQDYKFKAGVEYFQVITGGTIESFDQYVPQPIWESFMGQYVYGANMKFRWGKGYGSNSLYGKTPNGEVKTIALNNGQDQVYLGGSFNLYGTSISRKLVNIDISFGNIVQPFGSIIDNFVNSVNAIETTASGDLIVGGGFSECGAEVQRGVVKLTPNGGIDTTFKSNSDSGINSTPNNGSPQVSDIKIQVDTKIILCGIFDMYEQISLPFKNVIRLNDNGTVDNSFTPPSGSIKYSKVTLDENPSSVNYQKIYLATITPLGNKKVIRLHTNGTLDTTFNTTFSDSTLPTGVYVRSLKVVSDGKILIGLDTSGLISNGIQYYGILRLNTDGSVDTSFNGGNVGMVINSSVLTIEIDQNDKILVGGSFSSYNGQHRVNVLRLLSDGTIDGTFFYGNDFSNTQQSKVSSIKTLTNGDVIIGGLFSNSDITAQKNIRILTTQGKNKSVFSFSSVFAPLDNWKNVARGYTLTPEYYFNRFKEKEIIFLTRGVDPYTEKQTIEYDLSKMFNQTTGTMKVKGQYYLNIPIQSNTSSTSTQLWSIPGYSPWRSTHRTPESLDVINNKNPKIYHKPFNDFNIQSPWTSFTNNSVKFYTSTDKSRIDHKAYNDDGFDIGDFSNNGIYCPVSFTATDGHSTLGFSWSIGDPEDTFNPVDYRNNITFDQGSIEGVSFIGSNITPGNIIDLENSNNFIRVFAPSYHLENSTYDVSMTEKDRLVLRTDRLPTSTSTEISGNTSLPLFLNDNFFIYRVSAVGDLFTVNLSINQQTDTTNNAQDFTGDTQSQVSDAILNSLSCEGLTSLSCYSGYGGNFGVIAPCAANRDGDLTKQRIIGGCYYFVQEPYLGLFSIREDILFFAEWKARFRLTFAACRGVISHVFQNNWINGTLYSFAFRKKTIFDNQGGVKRNVFCGSNEALFNPVRPNQGPIYFDKVNNSFLYRSTPYSYETSKFVGQKPRYKTFFGLGDFIDANFKGMNDRNIFFPTTIMDLGPRDEFSKEICFNPQLDGYLVDTIRTTSYNDTSDILLFFILSRLLSSSFSERLLGLGDSSVNQLFSRSEDRLDGDVVQMFSINSEYGILPFNDDNYDDDDIFLLNTTPSISPLGFVLDGPVIGLYFSSNTQNRIQLTPGIATYGTVLQQNGYPTTQEVPMYKWEIDSTQPQILFGSELNEWYTDLDNGGFYSVPYQSMQFDTADYFHPQNGTGPFNGATGYIYNYDSNGNPNQNTEEWPQGQSKKFVVGAPYHFYFGLGKGKSAINRYITKYILG